MVLLHPLREMHPHEPLAFHRRGRKLISIRRLHILKPHVCQRQPSLAQSERSQEPLQESLRLGLVLRPCRPTVSLSANTHPHCPSSALLLLKIAHPLFSRHLPLLSFLMKVASVANRPAACPPPAHILQYVCYPPPFTKAQLSDAQEDLPEDGMTPSHQGPQNLDPRRRCQTPATVLA